MTTIKDTILRRIRAKRRGWVFTPKDFIDIASRSAIDVTLHRLAKQGIIRKLDKGIYDFPINHRILGIIGPSPDDIAKAIASKTGDTIQPSAAGAANRLGIDTQVPAKPVYLTSRSSIKKNVANFPIELKHSKYTIGNSLTPNVANTINAIRHLGKHNMSAYIINQIKRVLTKKDKLQLKKNISKFPDWMAPFIIQLVRR